MMNGESLPYLLRNDSMITIILFASLMLVAYVLSNGKKHLLQQLKYLIVNRERNNLFDNPTTGYAHYTPLLILHTCMLSGVCLYYYSANTQPALFQLYPHSLLLGGYVGSILVLLLAKYLCYGFINWIFFDKISNKAWINIYNDSIIWSGFFLLPIILLVVYFDLSLIISLFLVSIVIIISKIVLFYRGFSIFFKNFYGCFHLILYLCALEILPDVLLWESIVLINQFLLQ